MPVADHRLLLLRRHSEGRNTGGTIDAVHLTKHLDDVLQLAVSVRFAQAGASDMLRRLAAHPRQSGLAGALREIGRVEQTLLTRDWIGDPARRV